MSGEGPQRGGMARLRSPLRWRLLAALALVTGMQVGAVWAIWWPMSRDAAQGRSLAQTTDHLQTLGDSLVPYLIQNQMGAVYENLDAVGARHPAWLLLRLEGPAGEPLYPLQPPKLLSHTDQAMLQHPITYDGVSYGELLLLCDLGEITHESMQEARLLSIVLTISSLFLCLFLWFLIELMVIRPVRLLQQAAGSLVEGNYGATLPSPHRDEIGDLVTSFASMRSALSRQQRELEQATRDAQQANHAKSRFLASMSHEIRTPLHGIIALAELMDDPTLSPRQLERLHTLQRSAGHLLRLLNDILDVSRLEEGEYSLVLEPFSLSTLLDEVVMLVRPLARARGLRFAVEAPSFEGSIMGDRGRLSQVLLNLCSNAVKYTDQGEVVLRVQPRESGEMVTLQLAVEDTGIGISAQDLPHVFKRFVRTPDSGDRVGTGLGLTISQELVSLMGGQIQVRSILGQGSCFTVSLQLPRVAASPAQQLPTELAPPMRVLVVDDHPINRMVAEQLLSRDGHTVFLASSGPEAIQLCSEEALDLVLMDIQMPEMDGIEASTAIRALPHPAGQVPIAAFTASAFAEDLARYQAAGMNDCLSKPLTLDALRHYLLQVFRTHNQPELSQNPAARREGSYGSG